jgi:modification methylase
MNNLRYLNSIKQGDTLAVLKTLDSNFVDLGITSPPYNKQEKQKGWLVKNVKYDIYKDNKTEEEYQEDQISVLNEIFRITKDGGSFFYNHKTRWEKGEMRHPIEWLKKTKWVVKQEIIWDRTIAANIRGWRFWQVDERIYWLYKGIGFDKIGKELESKHALLTSLWRFPPERNNPHPAPFPLVLPTRIIASLLNDNEGVVLDPYCGSGTTLVAAKLLNKKFLGIDISQEYIEHANKRLKNAHLEGGVITEEMQKHVVKKTFKQRKQDGSFVGKFRKNQDKKFVNEDMYKSTLFQENFVSL